MRVRRAPLTLRALWWRRGVSAVILAVAVLTVAAAAVGPTYAHAAGESVLRDRLAEAAAADVGMAFEGRTGSGDEAATTALGPAFPAAGSAVGYPTRIRSLDAAVRARATTDAHPAPTPVLTQLVWREGACDHIVLVAGRCPSAAGEVAVTARTTAGQPEWDVGARGVLGRRGADVDVRVVGVYRARSQQDPFWFDRPYFSPHLYSGWGDGPDTVDAFLTDASTFASLPAGVETDYAVDYPLDATAVRLADVPGLRALVAKWRSGPAAAADADLRTALPTVLDRIEDELRLLDLAALVVCVQLALLAGLVLFQVVADTTEARGNEVALAKLRGLRPRSTVAVALAEPVVLLGLAVPLGVVAAWLASVWLAATFLLAGTPVVVTGGTWVAAAAAMVGGAVASVLAARRTLTRPVLEQWSGPPPRPRGRLLLVADLAVAAAALVGFAVLGAPGPEGATATGVRGVVVLLAPGLLVLAVALLAVRLVPLAARLGLPPTRASRHVGAFLALRQVTRRPAGLRLATLLAVALGLAVFAVGAESAAAANRASRAALELGAARVLQVSYEPGAHDPQAVVRAVDPDGRWAMAAARWIPDGGDVTGAVLAVDAARLPAVSRWDAAGTGATASAAASALAVPLPPPVPVSGDAVRVRLATDGLSGAPPLVTLVLRDRDGYQTKETTPLRGGTATYEADIACGPECRLVQIGFDRRALPSSPLRAAVTFLGAEERRGGSWQPLPAGFAEPGAWRPVAVPGAPPALSLAAVGDRLVATIVAEGSENPALERAESPLTVPAYVSGDAAPPGTAASVQDSQSHVVPLTLAAHLPRLPVVGADGLVLDLAPLRSATRGVETESQWYVWLGDAAPADAVARLTAAGLLVDGEGSLAARTDLLGRQGPALALRLLLACAVAGACLAAAAVAIAVAVTGRRRSFEIAALGAVGVPRRSLLGACVGEQVLLLGAGLLVGIPAGILAARLSLPLIPQFADPTAALLTYVPGAAPVAAVTAAAVVGVAVVAWVAGTLVLRAAVPARLREAER